MNIYTVTTRSVSAPWNLTVGPPVGPTRPRLVTTKDAHYREVAMGNQANVVLDSTVTGLYTMHLADCSAFSVLYQPRPGSGVPPRAAMVHMLGGPNPDAVDWASFLAGMSPDGVLYGVLANTWETVLSDSFCEYVLEKTPIREPNLWVYNAQSPARSINFAIGGNSYTGEI